MVLGHEVSFQLEGVAADLLGEAMHCDSSLKETIVLDILDWKSHPTVSHR